MEKVEEAVVLWTVMVPVAVMLATEVRLPENRALPWTESLDTGEVVPIPTLAVVS